MIFVDNYVSESKYGIKCPFSMNPIGITIHNTANQASALAEVKNMVNNNIEVSFHDAVDDEMVVHGIPHNRNAWHAGDGRGSGNTRHISIEICYSRDGGEQFEKAENNAAEYVAQLLKEHGWGVSVLKPHNYFSATRCPHRTNFGEFVNKVQRILDGGTIPTPEKPTTPSVSEVIFTGSVVADVLNVRSGPGTNHSVISSLKYGTNVDVIAQSNGWYQIEQCGKGWVSAEYIHKAYNTVEGVAYCTVDVLNVRTGRGTGYSIQGELNKNEKIATLGEKDGWTKVRYYNANCDSTMVGYVSSQYLTTSISYYPKNGWCTVGVLNVRNGAGTGYSIQGELNMNEKVSVISRNGAWYQVTYYNAPMNRNMTGWVHSDYLKL